MVIIVGIDALDKRFVDTHSLDELKQRHYGKTDISEFEKPRTMILWTSFLAGQSTEKEVLALDDIWGFKINKNRTFFSSFKFYSEGVPGISYHDNDHQRMRRLLANFFEAPQGSRQRREVENEYGKIANILFQYARHELLMSVHADFRKAKLEFYYFSLIDDFGHLRYGDRYFMWLLYDVIYQMMKEVINMCYANRRDLLIISDHGMELAPETGYFGVHSKNGFWSSNFCKLDMPKLTDFRQIIEDRIRSKSL